MDIIVSYNIVLCQYKNSNRRLIFRDYLRSHPDVAKEYEQLKAKVAQEHLYDREKYTDEKLDFVNKVLQLASLWRKN